jgi:hypothetical protein
VFVACATPAGAPADAVFVLTFADRTNLLGLPTMASGYAWANRPSVGSYRPDAAHSFDTAGGRPSIQRSGTGQYTLLLPGLAGVGMAHVAPTGGPARTCQVVNLGIIGSAEAVHVVCFDAAGSLADTAFVAQFLRRP